MPAKGADFLLSHPPPALLVTHAAIEQECQHSTTSTPVDKAVKRLDLLGHKVYSSTALQFHMSNYQALLAKYTFNNYTKLAEFLKDTPEDKHQWFQALLDKGHMMAKVSLQAIVDEVKMSSQSLATGVAMRCDVWLQLSGFPRVVQSTIEDFPFDKD